MAGFKREWFRILFPTACDVRERVPLCYDEIMKPMKLSFA